MVLVVILLESMEVSAFALWGVDVMEEVVSQIIHKVADQKSAPVEKLCMWVMEGYYLEYGPVPKYYWTEGQEWWEYKSISKYKTNLTGQRGACGELRAK